LPTLLEPGSSPPKTLCTTHFGFRSPYGYAVGVSLSLTDLKNQHVNMVSGT
jgi:hypothetical protein